MSTLVYQSTNTASSTTADKTITVTKPTGLSVGDLMIGHWVIALASGGATTMDGLSSFTLLSSKTSTTAASGIQSFIFYKIADSGDVAAANFTFTVADTETNKICGLSRFSGASATIPITLYSEYGSDSDTGITAPTLTPAYGNSFFCIASGIRASARTWSTYAIATNNPSWNEIYDTNNTGCSMSFANSNFRIETTASGNGTSVNSGAANKVAGQMLIINPALTTFTQSDTTSTTDTLLKTMKLTYTSTLTLVDTITSNLVKFMNQVKSVTSWLNQDKS
jgi:hypothetical protein